MDVLNRNDHDIVFASYFEPYALIATLAAKIRGIPVVIKHAGSDLGRLSQHKNLRASYSWMVENCDALVSPSVRQVQVHFPDAVATHVNLSRHRLPDIYRDAVELFDFKEHALNITVWAEALRMPAEVETWLRGSASSPLAADTFVIGTYGKVGDAKGSLDLLSALEKVARSGRSFYLVSLVAGNEQAVSRYVSRIMTSPELRECSRVYPAVLPWQVPNFIRSCDIIAFLERDFPITFHGPNLPREVLAGGKALLVSGEIATNRDCSRGLVNQRNCIVCADPKDHVSLAAAITQLIDDGDRRAAIARMGKGLSDTWEYLLPEGEEAVAMFIEELHEKVLR